MSSKSFISLIRGKEGPIHGVGLSIHSQITAQVAGLSGADFALIDMEHSPISAEGATQMVHAVTAASRGACFPLIRVPSHGVEWIKWSLDSGAAGIIVPMVNNATEMQQIIDKAVYPPAGRRSFGPSLAPFGDPNGPQSGVAGYIERAQRGDIAILPMIESQEGLDNAEAIVSTDGVSGVFIGPYDLRLALGLTGGLDGDEPLFLQAIEKVVAIGKKLNKVVGTMGIGEETARKRTADGMDFLVSTVDYNAVVVGFARDLTNARKGTGLANTSSANSQM